MSLGYRTILTTEATVDHLNTILEVFRTWLSNRKGFESVPTQGKTFNSAGAQLKTSQYQIGATSAFRWELVEDWDAPRWYKNSATSRRGVTHITLVYTPGLLWVWADVEPPTLDYVDSSHRARSELQPAGTPAFVRTLIDQLPLRDGLAEPLSDFQLVISALHVEELIRVVQDDTRLGAVYVSATPLNGNPEEWRTKSQKMVGAIQGMGIGYVLSPEATKAFNLASGFSHRVPAGGMRTFLPGAQFDDPSDSYNHKLLHPSSLQTGDERRIGRIIRSAQVARLGSTRLPRLLRDVDYEFLRMERLKPFESLPVVSDAEDKQLLDAVNVALVEKLKKAEADALQFLEDNYSQQDDIDLLQLEVDDLSRDVAQNYAELNGARDQIDYLRKQLLNLGNAEGTAAAFAPVPDDARTGYPKTFAELVDQVSNLDGVAFFGNKSDTEELDSHASLGETVVMKAWDAILTFSAYVAARNEGLFDSGLRAYVGQSQHGLQMRISQAKWGEGEIVRSNDALIAQRTVTGVPTAVAESGSIVMVAHIPLATHRANSPRLYFADTYSDAKMVCIGHIGGHLDNVSTN